MIYGIGTGIHAPADWHGVWVTNLRSGKPVLAYSPALATLVEARGMAAATVILGCDG